MRAALPLAAVLLLSACGGNVDDQPAAGQERIVPTEAAPPITAIDEPAPEIVEWSLNAMLTVPETGEQSTAGADIVVVDEACSTWSVGGPHGTADDDECPPLTPEQMEEARRIEELWRTALQPAPGTHPRSIARLTLSTGAQALFVMWRNGAGELCVETEIEDSNGSGGGGPSGPCLPMDPGCADLCVGSAGAGTNDGSMGYVLTGLVPATGEAARVTLSEGSVRTYPLAGPVIGDTGKRVLMIELGANDWRKLELIRGGQVVQESRIPHGLAVMEDCLEQAGRMPWELGTPTDDAASGWEDQMSACMRARLAEPGWVQPYSADMPAVPAVP